MRLVVTADERFVGTPDGAVWTTGTFAHSFWRRYLSVFDEVGVLARVLPVATAPTGTTRVDGPGVRVHALPHYIGPVQYVRRRRAVWNAVRNALADGDAVLVRTPSTIGNVLCTVVAQRGRPYGLEVVADPYDVFAPGSIEHPARPLLRRRFTAQLRRQCQAAAAVAYVTEHALQRRYPARTSAFVANYSSIELGRDAFAETHRDGTKGRFDTATVVAVGSLEQPYKGTDVLIRAVAQLRDHGVRVRLVLLGDGRYRPSFEALAARLGVAGTVVFTGKVPPGPAVRQHLDDADLFAMPSRAEGLPKALLEAMARGLPCVASTVGGIPELLAAEDLVLPGDATGLASRIREVLSDRDRMVRMSERNLARALDFSHDRLQPRREEFYRALRQVTSDPGAQSQAATGRVDA